MARNVFDGVDNTQAVSYTISQKENKTGTNAHKIYMEKPLGGSKMYKNK